MVQRLITDPELPSGTTKTVCIILPRPIEVNGTILAALNRGPLVEALCHQWVMLTGRGNQIKISLATLTRLPLGFHLLDLSAVTGQLVDDGFVLVFNGFQLLHQPGGTLQFSQFR